MQVGSIGSVTDVSAAYQAQSSLTTFNIAPFLTAGLNTIVVNAAGVVFGDSITSAPATVPEASTTVSFSLLLILGGTFFVVKKDTRKASE